MKRKFPHLCSPIQIGNVVFRNRMFCSPTGAHVIDPHGNLGFETNNLYGIRAKGGAASVCIGEIVVDPKTEGTLAMRLDITQQGSMYCYAMAASAIKRHGAVPTIELSHAGKHAFKGISDRTNDNKKKDPSYSSMPGVRYDGGPVLALTKDQIKGIVEGYKRTAKLAKQCGFEMILFHAGHGWLQEQFISPYFNQRTDEYGGSFENRMRLTMECLDAVREAVGPGFPIEFRMSGAEKFEGGYDIDYGVKIAKAVEDKVDLIHVSCGSYDGANLNSLGFYNIHPSMFQDHGCNVYLAEEIKKHVNKPVATIGALNDPVQMEEIIASGKADIVEMARALIADPDLPNKVVAGRDDEIVKCLRCFVCMAERSVTMTRRCTVNPLFGREYEGMEVLPAAKKKKVLVVGGGPGGMKAAITAKQRGHEVILCEKSSELGGILKGEIAYPFKREMYELGVTLARQMQIEGVDVRLNTEVTAEYIESLGVDALILAVGSTPIVPPIDGIGGENVIEVMHYHLHQDEVKDSVVVLGGGLAGCECAVHLGLLGKKVHIVEMMDEFAVDSNMKQRPKLLQMLNDNCVCHTGFKGTKITEEGLVCLDRDGNEVLVPGETVICAVGHKPNRKLVDELRDSAPWVREIGDCVKAATIYEAVYQGYHAGLDA